MARKAAELTQSAVAEVLECGQGKIQKIESTLVSVNPAELDKLIELYQVPQDKAAELRQLAELDRHDAPARTRFTGAWSAFANLSDLEPAASEILCWHSERIPGPLQSELYMLRQHRPEAETMPGVVRLLGQRKARAQIFTMDDPPHYRVILSESSLHRMPGGRSSELVVDQIEHLLTLIHRHERLELRILTFNADVRFVDSDFQILRFADDRPDFTYIEYPGGSRSFTGREELGKFQEHWELLREAALSRADSENFLHALAKRDEPTDRRIANSE